MTDRIRGRKGVELRKRRLRNEPLCRHCFAKGIITPADQVDHIIPLSAGGTDTDDNIQCLCLQCHAVKTASEAAQGFASSTHPDWLRPSAIPLTIVCGPPASGKTTYVHKRSHPADLVIDLDVIASNLSGQSLHGWDRDEWLSPAIRARNEMLGFLSRAKSGKAWFIVSAPSQDERNWWQSKLGGQVVLLDPGPAECKRRALRRGTPKTAHAIDEWYRKSRAAWRPRGKRDEFTANGRVVW